MKFILNKDTLEIENNEIIVSGSVNYYKVDVEYDESWNDLNIKAIIVETDNKKGISRAVINNKMYIDQSLNGVYSIGFVGYKIENDKKTYQISSNLRKIYIDVGAGEIKTEVKDVPTPSEWEIYISQIQEFIREGQEIITQASNLNLDVNKVENVSTISVTSKNGTTKKVEILDGKDYILTENDKNEIAKTVKPLVKQEIQPTLDGIKDTAETAVSIAKGANQSLVYENYSTMITTFNSLKNDVYKVGQNILIITLNVPDLWISEVLEENTQYSYTSDKDFISILEENGSVQIGYYKISALETQKVVLSEYVTQDEFNEKIGEISSLLDTINGEVI